MKTIILNASPGKNRNTAMMLKEAQRGAESAGNAWRREEKRLA